VNRVKEIRSKLGLSQSGLAEKLGMTQANISNYERDAMIPPNVARDLIAVAKGFGLALTFDHIYGSLPLSVGGVVDGVSQPEAWSVIRMAQRTSST
jgi:putative transcriptional regulator